MFSTKRAGRLLAWALAISLGATACGGSSASSRTSSRAPKFGSEEFGLTPTQLATRVEDVETSTGKCMAAAGFEYVPVAFERVRKAMTSDKSAPGLSDEEYINQYGFGVTTQFDKPGREIGLGEQNIRIYENLSTEDQAAYDHALFGENPDATFALTLEAEDFSETGGCTRKAIEQYFKANEFNTSYINPGDVVIDQDPRVIKAIAKWSDCVRTDTGFDYSHPDDIESGLDERLQAITGGVDPTSLTGSAKDALIQLQNEERATAKAAYKCEEQVLQPVIDDVEAEI